MPKKQKHKDDTSLPNKTDSSKLLKGKKKLSPEKKTVSRFIVDKDEPSHNGMLGDSISKGLLDAVSSDNDDTVHVTKTKVNIDAELQEDMEIRNNLLVELGSSVFSNMQKRYDDYKRIEKEK